MLASPKSYRKMLLIPLRSDTNASERPSGAQAGLIFFPWSMCPSTSMVPLSRWNRAIRILLNVGVSKAVAGARSVADAIVFPSGLQDQCRSAHLWFGSRFGFELAAVLANR